MVTALVSINYRYLLSQYFKYGAGKIIIGQSSGSSDLVNPDNRIKLIGIIGYSESGYKPRSFDPKSYDTRRRGGNFLLQMISTCLPSQRGSGGGMGVGALWWY